MTVAMAVIRFRRLGRMAPAPEVPQGFARPEPELPPRLTKPRSWTLASKPRWKTVGRSIMALIGVEAPPTDGSAATSLKAQMEAFLDGSELTISAHVARAAALLGRLGVEAGSMSAASGGAHSRSIEVHEHLLRRKDDLSHRARQVGT